MTSRLSPLARVTLLGASCLLATAAAAQPGGGGDRPGNENLLTISPFTLRTHCQVVQATIEEIIKGGVAGFEHVKPREDFGRGGVRCDSGDAKYTSFGRGRQMTPFTFHFPHNERPGRDDVYFGSDFHNIQFDDKGQAAVIYMQREWAKASNGPRRNEVIDTLNKRYGRPAAIYYSDTAASGSVEMTWGTNISKVKDSTPAIFGPKFAKGTNLCATIQEFDPVKLKACLDWSAQLRKDYFAVGKRETDVVLQATLFIHPDSNEVSLFRLKATDVAPAAEIAEAKELAAKATSETIRLLEEQQRKTVQPRF